jgi:hypothetical protein
VRRILIASAVLLLGAGAWWLQRERVPAGEPPVVSPGEPLELDEPVRMRWVDEETGEEDVWTVTKREVDPEEQKPPLLPEPDPDAGDHVPDESARTLLAMGLESWKRGEVVEAMEQLESAIEADPEDPLPRTQYGRLLVLAMSYSDALPQLERAAELTPDDPQVWLDLATFYEKTRVLDRSWAARQRADELLDGQTVVQDPMGFWVIEGASIFP